MCVGILGSWMRENQTVKWTVGLPLVEHIKNRYVCVIILEMAAKKKCMCRVNKNHPQSQRHR